MHSFVKNFLFNRLTLLVALFFAAVGLVWLASLQERPPCTLWTVAVWNPEFGDYDLLPAFQVEDDDPTDEFVLMKFMTWPAHLEGETLDGKRVAKVPIENLKDSHIVNNRQLCERAPLWEGHGQPQTNRLPPSN